MVLPAKFCGKLAASITAPHDLTRQLENSSENGMNTASAYYLTDCHRENVPTIFRIKTLDVRGKSLSTALHDSASEVFGSRAYFRTNADPAFLSVEDIRRHDQGLYRCRVDFRNTATKSFRYNLTIIGKYKHLKYDLEF
ncbi:hypothetical protein V9T40_000167 [Parthenolecanium corni]|uniref:Ig-like domain-containing protein n=1 Tax=Parthenolecanium corni TaxID=536013 RepID=A0AAN9TG05_9HEMI